MVEYERNTQREQNRPGPRTCIVGIGGAGSNVLDRITLDRTVEAHLLCLHTDVRVLSHAMAPNKIQLAAELMRGIGAGGDPELGREAAMFSRDEVRAALEGYDIIFICVGLGGGTGSGAAPVVAEIAKTTNALVFVTATMPFSFEGRRRLAQAEESLELLQKRADALILFENNRMGELILPKDGIQKAFSQADQLIAQSLRAVSTIVTMPGLVKLGLDDLTSALSGSNGRCLFGFGEARGQNRGSDALKRALKSPLIDQGRLLHQTKTLLVHIAGGESLTLVEVDAVMKQLGRNVPDHTHILFGVAVDAKLGEAVAVTLISSLGLAQLNAQASAAPPAEMLQQHRVAREMPSIASALVAPSKTSAGSDERPRAAEQAAAPAPAALTVEQEPEPEAELQPEPESAPEEEHMELFTQEHVAPVASNHQPEAQPSSAQESELFADSFPEARSTNEQDGSEPEATAEDEEEHEEPEAAAEEPAVDQGAAEELREELEPEPPAATEPPWSEPEAPKPKPKAAPTPRPSLASVIARTNVATEEDGEAPAYGPTTTTVTPKKPTPTEQIAFRFGEDDRGRFKDTEPALVQGEDLDVPTWMRLKRKLRK